MLPVSGAWQLSVWVVVSASSYCTCDRLPYLCSPVHPAHELSTARVLEIRQARALREVVGQEQVPQSLGLCLLAQVGDDGGCRPPRRLQLCLVDALGGHALILDPIVDLLDLFNGNGPQLCFDPRWDARKCRVALDLDVGGHVGAVLL